MLYSREKIQKLENIKTESEELVCITYMNEYKKYVNVWGDSCIAIISDIYSAIYLLYHIYVDNEK